MNFTSVFLKRNVDLLKTSDLGGVFSLSVLGNLKPHVLGIAIFISSQCLSQPPDLFCSVQSLKCHHTAMATSQDSLAHLASEKP